MRGLLTAEKSCNCRNSLGRSEGGSGVALDRKAYEESVKYWEGRASVIEGSPSGE